MSTAYRLFGAETSPYSMKLKSYLSYKKLPFEWVPRGFGTEEEFQTLAKTDALPMLVSPKGGVAHDTGLILSRIEAAVSQPSATPDDAACHALSTLIEAYADEWLSKAMFHYRWGDAKSAKASATRQADAVFQGYEVEGRGDIEKSIAKSMSGRLKTIGLNKKNGAIVETSFERLLKLLNTHLEHHLFLFGGHPSFADFALAGQLSQLKIDERSGAMIQDQAPFVAAWCEFMEEPRSGAPFTPLADLAETLLPLIRDEIVPTYMMWALETKSSITSKRKTITVEIDGEAFKQSVQTHAVPRLDAVTDAFARTPHSPEFESFLEDAGLAETFDLGTLEPAPKPEAPAEEAQSEDETPDSEDAKPKPRRRNRNRRRRKPRGQGNSDGGSESAAPVEGGGETAE